MSQHPKHSVHLFGSRARGDIDAHSDQDVLVIYEGARPSPHFEAGATPNFYRVDHLEKLAKEGNLFCKHIIDESKFVSGRVEYIDRIKANFQRRLDYHERAKSGAILFDATTRTLTQNNCLIYGDIYAVALRNYLIQMAASDNNYLFSFESLAAYGYEKFSLPEFTLPNLRELKFAYRNGKIASDRQLEVFKDASANVNEFIHSQFHSADIDDPPRFFDDKYVQLRDFEAWYVSNSEHLNPAQKKAAEKLVFAAKRPSGYRFYLRNDFDSDLAAIRSML